MKESTQSLRREMQRLSAQLELQHRQISVLEQRLQESVAATGRTREACAASMPALVLPAGRHVPKPRPARPSPAFWPTKTDDPDPLVPKPGFANFALKGVTTRVIGISACGFDRPALEAIVATVESRQTKSRDFVPVFLTDSNEFDCFRTRGFVFEYLPPIGRRRMAGAMNWEDYAADRLVLLMRKWGFSEVIVFGKNAFGKLTDGAVAPEASMLPDPAAGPMASEIAASPSRRRTRRMTDDVDRIVAKAPVRKKRPATKSAGKHRTAGRTALLNGSRSR